jgi:2-keto-4-pentenoate hydratase/2-oxohepta-3-ene-1,7-dioic acid hydratase in catechol pathway
VKIFCVGRNYADHVAELKNEAPAAPVVFMKPSTAILRGGVFYHPSFSKDIHYECELVYRICKNGKYIAEEFASKYYDAVTVGIDFTARDIQDEQKKKGLPWEIAKGQFSLHKNGKQVQAGSSVQMTYSIEKIISYISVYFTLQQGDMVFTGTPAGVGTIHTGDLLQGYLEDEKQFDLTVN